MDMLLVLLGLGSLIAMVVGLIKPGLVIRWGEKKTRPRVLMIYGCLFVASFIILGMTGNGNANVQTQKVDQANPVSTASNATPEMKYNNAQAKARISDWLGEHEFPGVKHMDLEYTCTNGKLFEVDGKEYHRFLLSGIQRAVYILVDPYTGELLYHDTIGKPWPIDKWYSEYRRAYNTNSSANERINENFEWVEKPTVRDGAIIGKIRNISNREQMPTISFALYDNKGNQIGTASDTLTSFKSGNTWSFKAPVNNARVTNYEFLKIY